MLASPREAIHAWIEAFYVEVLRFSVRHRLITVLIGVAIVRRLPQWRWRAPEHDEFLLVLFVVVVNVLFQRPWLESLLFAVALVLFYSWIPFVALPIFVVLENMDRRLLEAAEDLGASSSTAFWRVTFPLSLPGVIAGFVFVLIPTTGEFITPLLVGGPDSQLFGNQIQSFFSDSPDWNYGSVLAMTLIVVVLILMMVFGRYISTDLRAATSVESS